jgi:hypothetical protein
MYDNKEHIYYFNKEMSYKYGEDPRYGLEGRSRQLRFTNQKFC